MRKLSDTQKILIGVAVIILLQRLFRDGAKEALLLYACMMPGLFLSISVHEAAHAFMAYKLGDDTAKNQGRMTLNPLKHIDVLGLISLFVFKIGWGKPVEYNPRSINVKDIKKAEAKIALAGPVSNFILALILAFPIIYLQGIPLIERTKFLNIIYLMLTMAFTLSIGLGLFNLIPFPPLDGSKIFYKLYEGNLGRFVRQNEFVLSIAFFALIYSGAVGSILMPLNNLIQNSILKFSALFF